MNGVLIKVGKWLLGLGEFLLMRVFVVCTSLVALHCDCGGGKMKWAVKKMKWNECKAGRLTKLLDMVLRYGSHRKYKKLSDEKLKICAKQVGYKKLGYFKWWVMGNKWWKLSGEWWVISILPRSFFFFWETIFYQKTKSVLKFSAKNIKFKGLGLGPMHPVYWTQSNGDTCLKVNTCYHLNGSNIIGHWT